MGVLVIVELTAKADRQAELVQTFKEIVPDTRNADGCEWCHVYVDQDDPNRLSIVEMFESRDHYNAYFAWRQERGDLDMLGAMLDGPPTLRFFDDTGA